MDLNRAGGSPHVAGQGDVKTEQEKPNLSRFPSKSVHFQQEENVIFVFFFQIRNK